MPEGLALISLCPQILLHDLLLRRMQSGKPLILVVEDDPVSAEALSLVLEDWGAEVVQAANGAEVDAKLSNWVGELHFIIADFDLGPGPDGIAIASAIRAKTAPHARVLVLTGTLRAHAHAAREHQFELMQKPAAVEAILAWLEAR